MALVKLGTEIVAIKGRCGGNIFKRDASGQHIIAQRRVVHRHDIHQSPMTNSQAFSGMPGLAALMIAAGYAAFWIIIAGTWWFVNKLGEKVRLNWWQWFIHFNLMPYKLGLPPILKPPLSP